MYIDWNVRGNLVIEGEWDSVLGERVKGLLNWGQAGAHYQFERERDYVMGHLT